MRNLYIHVQISAVHGTEGEKVGLRLCVAMLLA